MPPRNMLVQLSTPYTDPEASNSPPPKFNMQYEDECIHYAHMMHMKITCLYINRAIQNFQSSMIGCLCNSWVSCSFWPHVTSLSRLLRQFFMTTMHIIFHYMTEHFLLQLLICGTVFNCMSLLPSLSLHLLLSS